MQCKLFIVPYNGLLLLLQVYKCIKTSIKQVNEKFLVRAQIYCLLLQASSWYSRTRMCSCFGVTSRDPLLCSRYF